MPEDAFFRSPDASRYVVTDVPDPQEKVFLVRATIQSMVNRGVKAREHIFW